MGVSLADMRSLLGIVAAVVAVAAVAVLAEPAPSEADSRCGAESALPGSVSTAKAERTVLCLLNRERSKRNLPKLDRQGQLDRASREHSRHMVDSGCFAHECPGEPELFDRLAEAGYLAAIGDLLRWGYGENIAWGGGSLGSSRSIVRAWMRSDGHRRNILSPEFEQIGVGLVWGSPESNVGPAATYTTDFGFRER